MPTNSSTPGRWRSSSATVAAAGKKEYALPMYVNAALRDPFHPGQRRWLRERRPTDNVICYLPRRGAGHRHRGARHLHEGVDEGRIASSSCTSAGGPLLVPEIGNDPLFARYFYDVLGAQAIGIVPFGMDYTGYSNFPLGAKNVDEAIDAFARPYRLLAPMARDWARLSFTKKVWGASEPDDRASRTLDLGRWTGHAEFQRVAVRHEGVVWPISRTSRSGQARRRAARCWRSSVPMNSCSPASTCACPSRPPKGARRTA